MTGHDHEVERPAPLDRGKVAEDPLHVRPLASLFQHRLGWIESTQPPRVSFFPRQAQQLAGAAADIEHAIR